jgi:uncharacterized SAM-binding protein YcdF (DUF218 family)
MDLLLFIAKKVVSTACYPLGTSLLFLFMGLVFWCVRPRSRTGVFFVLAGTAWLTVMSLPITGFMMLRSLERDAGHYANAAELRSKDVRFIVVMGGDRRLGDLTPVDRIACTSLVRVLEGIRIWKGLPEAKLVLSGGGYEEGVVTSAEGMATLATEMGVPRSAIIVESQSLDTGDEARILKPVLDGKAFTVVTSASHMRRSLMNFTHVGLAPIPAPADFEAMTIHLDLLDFLPRAQGLQSSQKAIHEYLGIWALLLRQRVQS